MIMSKIQSNRVARYNTLSQKRVSKDLTVFSRDTRQIGYIIGEASPYTGEAGLSYRAIVLWSNGKVTHCNYKGMSFTRKGWAIL
jgi:hypothetical protein